MNKNLFTRTKTIDLTKVFSLLLMIVFVHFLSLEKVSAQKKTLRKSSPAAAKKVLPKQTTVALNLPKVTQIDLPGLRNLINRENGSSEAARPLLINFWATWCDPCREEFPDLVKLNADYRGKIDFITVSMDELSELNRDVPKFLAQMKATMPAYLLKTNDEEQMIDAISKDWQGGLPFTILYNAKGETVFTKMGKVKPDALRAEIDKLANQVQKSVSAEKEQSSEINLRPFKDFCNKYSERVLRKEVDINSPFLVQLSAKLGENGKFIEPKMLAQSGQDVRIIEMAKDAISASSDSGLMKPFYDLGVRDISISLAQDEKNLTSVIKTETESEMKSKTLMSMLNLILSMRKSEVGSNEVQIINKVQVETDGKFLIVNFAIPQTEKNQLLEKQLKNCQNNSANE